MLRGYSCTSLKHNDRRTGSRIHETAARSIVVSSVLVRSPRLGSLVVARRIVQGWSEFNALTERHLHDAKILLDDKRPQGAVYLAGYAAECIIKARLCVMLGIPRWTKECLDHLQERAWSHELTRFASLAGASQQTLARIHRLNWDTQLRYHPMKIPLPDGTQRHAIAVEIVQDIRGLMGIA